MSIERIKALVKQLDLAAKAYYQESKEIMSNYEYDQLYDELLSLEKETGIVLSDSPSQKVGYEVVTELPKERHQTKMLSLDKTKDVSVLKAWLKDQKALLSWKLDGLTIVLTYKNGILDKAVTRGNGEIGEVITNNARVFKNIPLSIPYEHELVVRGEAIIKYSDFERINSELEQEEQYKNPRNLCSGSVRQLNNKITASRNVCFYAFQLLNTQVINNVDSKSECLEFVKKLGFEVVDYEVVNENTLEAVVKDFENRISGNDFGSDGLVITYDSISYSQSLGETSKFPKDSLAFKWRDEIRSTKLLEIEWSASRTGLINPIAVFEPIELEGTTVSRASVHNISILEELELGIGDEIEVYKANMIIPQIASNLTKSNNVCIPSSCPVCNGKSIIKQVNQIKALYCENPDCAAKKIKLYAHFVSRDALNIEGLSEATLQKFVDKGFIHSLVDIFKLEQYEAEITCMEGFGSKSFENLMKALQKASITHIANFIYALGIPNVGLSNAKLICKHLNHDIEKIMKVQVEDLITVQGFGDIIANSVVNYFSEKSNVDELYDLLKYIRFEKEENNNSEMILQGKIFVITGSVLKYSNRNALKALIESLGGKVTGTVTSKTDYLINNDVTSSSSKNKTAKELNVPIIDEQEFEKLLYL